jgi:hypothetical protein
VFRLWYIIIIIAALILGGFLVVDLRSRVAGSSTTYTCVVCRLGQVEKTVLALKSSSFYENECSRWYQQNVEPNHTHIWERGTCTKMLNGFGQSMGFACMPGHFPIWMLSPSTQMNVYQHFNDRRKAKELYTNLTDAKTHHDRLDEQDESKGDLIVKSMTEWEAAEFPGTWDDWWTRWWDKHVAERKEWLEWLHSGCKISFWEWKDRQKALSVPETERFK